MTLNHYGWWTTWNFRFAEDPDEEIPAGGTAISEDARKANQAVDEAFDGDDEEDRPVEDKPQDGDADDDEPSTPDDKADDSPDVFPEALLTRAESLGVSSDTVRARFSSPKDLEAALELIEAIRAEVPAEASAKTPEETGAEDEPYDCGLSADEFDPTLVKAINKIGQDAMGTIRQLQKQNAELQERLQSLGGAWATRQLDDLFASAPEEYRDALGEGGVDDLDTDSPAFKNRSKVVKAMAAIATGLQETGQPVPSQKSLFRKALAQVFDEDTAVKKARDTQVKARLDKRAKASMGRPGGALKATTAAAQAAEANRRLDELL